MALVVLKRKKKSPTLAPRRDKNTIALLTDFRTPFYSVSLKINRFLLLPLHRRDEHIAKTIRMKFK